jgi:hypothetical protein
LNSSCRCATSIENFTPQTDIGLGNSSGLCEIAIGVNFTKIDLEIVAVMIACNYHPCAGLARDRDAPLFADFENTGIAATDVFEPEGNLMAVWR